MKNLPHRQRIFMILVAFRWASLLPAAWLIFQRGGHAPSFGVSPILIFLIALASAFLILLFHRALNQWLVRRPLLLGLDLLFNGALLLFTGGVQSPYYLTALSPLFAGAFFFQIRGGLITAAAFSPIYLIAVFLAGNNANPGIVLNLFFIQFVGFWLTTVLFGYMSSFLFQLRETRDALAEAGKDLEEQNKELSLTHRQLKIAYDLTVLLQAAPDVLSVQERVLSAIIRELGFSKAAVGLVEPGTNLVGSWLVYPHKNGNSSLPSLSINSKSSLVAKALHEMREVAFSEGGLQGTDKEIHFWVGEESGFITPLFLREHIIGILLVVNGSAEPLPAEERLTVLKLVAGQVAVALGTTMMCIDRAQQLAIEQERNRIARDIHDSVSQSLFGIAFTLDASIDMLPGQADVVKQELIDLQTLANQAREQVRRSIFDLWPSDLTKERFETDLQQYVNSCSIPHPYSVRFNVSTEFNNLANSVRRNLYRVTQEALANAARHSKSEGAEVCLSIENGWVHLKIKDQGKGFDPVLVLNRENNRERFGLHGIQERVQGMGGECEILSFPNHGVQILISVPRNGEGIHA